MNRIQLTERWATLSYSDRALVGVAALFALLIVVSLGRTPRRPPREAAPIVDSKSLDASSRSLLAMPLLVRPGSLRRK